MRVRLLKQPFWTLYGREWPKPGTVIDVPPRIAEDLLREGAAEVAEEREKATRGPLEVRNARRSRSNK